MPCSPARALMRERSKSRAELLSLSSSSSDRSKRVLMWLYCCVISALSKSMVDVMALASVAGGGGDGLRRPRCQEKGAGGGWVGAKGRMEGKPGGEDSRGVSDSWKKVAEANLGVYGG